MISKGAREFTVLLVDDRPENIMVLQEILEKDNRKFISALSGNEALKTVWKNPSIGLIMLDVQMPDMDGFEVARMLKSNSKTKDIAIIFVTAISKDVQYVMQGFDEGAVDYLQKPLDINVTKAKVNVSEKLFFYQQQLKESLLEVEKVNKQLEKFVYMVSHDLKSPLASIITVMSSIKGNSIVETDPLTSQKIDLVYMASNHLAEMINAILEYSKQSFAQQTVEEVNVFELVNQIAFLLFPPQNITITVSQKLPVILTRKIKLQQVFQNLLSNAIKYSDKPDGVIEVNVFEKDQFYVFSVKDNGPGMARIDADRIFRLFETGSNTSNNDSSTGVGLNILKVLVEEQGGKIWAESVEGEGSTFYFEWRK
ncbi:hybrid sensor histidine kinase/response regulator [Segetibacter sp.]|jgi:two-component system sensor histidine kinase/response regulator|uniref:sensor histidine kinase n=1 Tax=Segetibacter sp. TaxID=2231182 RepID=UPI0026362065|nr:hybrid sensor histidine kinase/response regulator [Segetibacter sp.]MCW3080635.1 chemotaxis regulator - transmits chemoreceptor signals to flagelllar motor component cheY [Segetibacter sp.]